jgi:hypothetical protein
MTLIVKSCSFGRDSRVGLIYYGCNENYNLVVGRSKLSHQAATLTEIQTILIEECCAMFVA